MHFLMTNGGIKCIWKVGSFIFGTVGAVSIKDQFLQFWAEFVVSNTDFNDAMLPHADLGTWESNPKKKSVPNGRTSSDICSCNCWFNVFSAFSFGDPTSFTHFQPITRWNLGVYGLLWPLFHKERLSLIFTFYTAIFSRLNTSAKFKEHYY